VADIQAEAAANMQALGKNSYPGRGIVIGRTPDGRRLVQVYWIMGRSANSRNRVFVAEGDRVRTQAWDEAKVEDPSRIIYNAVRVHGSDHVVTNGDQTDTICEFLESGRTFGEALATRTYEPDPPNYTPRISGIVRLGEARHPISLSILKADDAGSGGPGEPGDPGCTRQLFHYERATPGIGRCIHTYAGDGSPLPPFAGEPYAVPLLDDAGELADLYWRALDEDNKVSLLVKSIDAESGASQVKVINKHA
jgi:hypothetical protein